MVAGFYEGVDFVDKENASCYFGGAIKYFAEAIGSFCIGDGGVGWGVVGVKRYYNKTHISIKQINY